MLWGLLLLGALIIRVRTRAAQGSARGGAGGGEPAAVRRMRPVTWRSARSARCRCWRTRTSAPRAATLCARRPKTDRAAIRQGADRRSGSRQASAPKDRDATERSRHEWSAETGATAVSRARASRATASSLGTAQPQGQPQGQPGYGHPQGQPGYGQGQPGYGSRKAGGLRTAAVGPARLWAASRTPSRSAWEDNPAGQPGYGQGQPGYGGPAGQQGYGQSQRAGRASRSWGGGPGGPGWGGQQSYRPARKSNTTLIIAAVGGFVVVAILGVVLALMLGGGDDESVAPEPTTQPPGEPTSDPSGEPTPEPSDEPSGDPSTPSGPDQPIADKGSDKGIEAGNGVYVAPAAGYVRESGGDAPRRACTWSSRAKASSGCRSWCGRTVRPVGLVPEMMDARSGYGHHQLQARHAEDREADVRLGHRRDQGDEPQTYTADVAGQNGTTKMAGYCRRDREQEGDRVRRSGSSAATTGPRP